jgi:hypothetical protein
MGEAGYTLAETLAALLILSMAVSGLYTGVELLGRRQAVVGHMMAAVEDQRTAQSALERLFEGLGPYRTSDPESFSGNAAAATFACGAAARCTVAAGADSVGPRLVLATPAGARVIHVPGQAPLRLVYQGELGDSAVWPPNRGRVEHLRSIRVLDAAQRPLAAARLWRGQAQDCAFDPIAQDCR